ncbi:cell envelope integrity EipB family protein [Terrarubrum flagellatum]|uniref:cell envelope integrity EipB family protein n=1 Tax=Terrirubrum flagellatum TaxID=2895980 RepID=UPI0031453E8E
MLLRSFSAAALACALATPAFAATPIVLAPHRAVYDLSLVKAGDMKGVDDARGRIVFEVNGSVCEGYSSSFRQVVEMQSSEAGSRLLDVRSSSFEEAEGKGYRFQIDRSVNREDQPSAAGRTQTRDGVLAVQLTKPKTDSVKLPEKVMFPTFHTRALIEAAEAGQNTLSVRTYDGSDEGQAIYDTFAVIGAPITHKPDETIEDSARVPALQQARSWPVTISYYKIGNPDQNPAYVISMELYENGVSRNLKLDYGSLVLKGDLARLDFSKPAAECK